MLSAAPLLISLCCPFPLLVMLFSLYFYFYDYYLYLFLFFVFVACWKINARPLTVDQVRYAALDAHCLVGIFEEMLLERGGKIGPSG